jgi:hypothetical protein
MHCRLRLAVSGLLLLSALLLLQREGLLLESSAVAAGACMQ